MKGYLRVIVAAATLVPASFLLAQAPATKTTVKTTPVAKWHCVDAANKAVTGVTAKEKCLAPNKWVAKTEKAPMKAAVKTAPVKKEVAPAKQANATEVKTEPAKTEPATEEKK